MSWTHLEDSTPKAKKEYQCYLCGLKINVGEKHVKRTGTADFELITQRMHIRCEALTNDWEANDWENFDEDEFRQELNSNKS